MNQKIFVFVAIVALAAALALILLSNSFVNQQSKEIIENSQINSSQILPISITIDDIKILKVTERDANIEIKFQIDNPNSSSVIVQVIDYQLFETGFSSKTQISGGQIGSRAGGMVEFGNNYYTLLGENSITLKDEIKLKNTGNAPELWKILENDSAKWKITGIVYYNLSSMTSGQENELPFEFTNG